MASHQRPAFARFWSSYNSPASGPRASIASDGRTAHVRDPGKQIDLTMEVVKAILESRGQTFADVTRAVAYFRSPTDYPLFTRWCSRNGAEIPAVSAWCDICRDDLLFEIELDALSCF